MKLKEIPVDKLEPSEFAAREGFGDLESLGKDMKDKGQLEPLIARPKGDGKYEIVAGERRWRAAKEEGFEKLNVLVKEMDDKNSIFTLVSENIYRENLKPHELGKIVKLLQVKFGLDIEEIAEKFGKGTSTLRRYIKDYETFEDTTKELIKEGKISTTEARLVYNTLRDKKPETIEKTLEAQAEYNLPKEAFEKTVRNKIGRRRREPQRTFEKVKKRLEKEKKLEGEETVKYRSGESKLHHSIKTAVYQWLDRNNYGVKSEIGEKGKRIPDLTGEKGNKTLFIEAETLHTVFNKKELPDLEDKDTKKIMAIPNKVKERADEIWLVDPDTKSVEKKLKL